MEQVRRRRAGRPRAPYVPALSPTQVFTSYKVLGMEDNEGEGGFEGNDSDYSERPGSTPPENPTGMPTAKGKDPAGAQSSGTPVGGPGDLTGNQTSVQDQKPTDTKPKLFTRKLKPGVAAFDSEGSADLTGNLTCAQDQKPADTKPKPITRELNPGADESEDEGHSDDWPYTEDACHGMEDFGPGASSTRDVDDGLVGWLRGELDLMRARNPAQLHPADPDG